MKKFEGYKRGIDFGGWFSQCNYTEDRFDNFIKAEDFERVGSWGIDHIRLPFDYNLVQTEEGEFIEKGFQRLAWAVLEAKKYNLNVILDLHKTYGYSFDAGEKQEGFFDNEVYQERFYVLWEEVAKRFAAMHDHVAFELLNEVTDPSYSDSWNRIASTCINRIRAISKDVSILIGGYWNNSPDALRDLEVPIDENIVYNFHCYDPLLFTHQGAGWVEQMPADFRLSFSSTYKEYLEITEKMWPEVVSNLDAMKDIEGPVNSQYFINRFANAVAVAKEKDVDLYCGEYGVINRADPHEALAWLKAIHEAFEYYGIGRAAWSYREMDFGYVDEHFAPVLDEAIKYL